MYGWIWLSKYTFICNILTSYNNNNNNSGDIIGSNGACSNQYIIDPNTGFRTSIASLSSAAGTSIASIQGASYINSHLNYSDIENEHNKFLLHQQAQHYQHQLSESPMASASVRQDVSSTGGATGRGGTRRHYNNLSAPSHGAGIDYSVGNTGARSDQHHTIYNSSHSGVPLGAPGSEKMM